MSDTKQKQDAIFKENAMIILKEAVKTIETNINLYATSVEELPFIAAGICTYMMQLMKESGVETPHKSLLQLFYKNIEAVSIYDIWKIELQNVKNIIRH